jgi:hypothetical protein
MPLVVQGSLLGVAAALLGLLGLYSICWLSDSLPLQLSFLSPRATAAIVLSGLFSGATGGYLAARRLLR